MRYIIEHNENINRWYIKMPELETSSYGIEYTEYNHDGAWSLDEAIRRAYVHRYIHANWDASMFINGKEVLFTKENGIYGRTVRFVDGTELEVAPVKTSSDDTITAQDYL